MTGAEGEHRWEITNAWMSLEFLRPVQSSPPSQDKTAKWKSQKGTLKEIPSLTSPKSPGSGKSCREIFPLSLDRKTGGGNEPIEAFKKSFSNSHQKQYL